MSQYFEGVGRLYLNHIKDFKIPITSFFSLRDLWYGSRS